jgi:hypothetical protein
MKRLGQLVLENRKVILLTFEIFWIVVFLLDAASKESGAGVAQFVYVNF